MKRKIVRIASVLCAVIAVVAVCIIAIPEAKADVSKDSTVQALEDQMKYLELRQQELQNQLNKNQNDMYNQQVYQEQLENLISTVQSKIQVANDLIDSLKANRADLEAQIAELEIEIDESFEEFLERIRISYEEGSVTYIGMIFGADSLRDFLSRIDRVSSMLEYNKNLVEEYKKSKATLENKKKECELAIELQDAAIADLEKTKAENVALLNNSELYLAQLKNNQSSYQNQLSEYNKAWEQANAELTAYLEELAKKSQEQYNGEGFAWPMDSRYYNYMTSAYGWRWIFGADDWHLGIDIWGYNCFGASINASSSGKVVIADANGYSSYGKYVVIDHGNGITTLYAHMDTVKVTVGQKVVQGQSIGTCGVTGRVTGAHLHFEYRINGQHKDPLDYINIPSNFVDISG